MSAVPDLPHVPSREDPVPAGASALVGGPPGSRARLGQQRTWTALRWVLLLTLLVSGLGFAQKAPCRVHPWADDYQYTRACYTDVFALYYAEGLNEDKVPYLDHPVEYPVVIGAVMGLVDPVSDAIASLSPDDADGDPEAYRFYDVTWFVLTAFALVAAATTAKLAGRRPWDAAMFALAPSLLLHGTTNWDLVAVALAGLGMLAWARRMPVTAGVMLGLGAATKLYPAFFVLPLLVLCWRAGVLRPAVRTTVAAAVTLVALVVPVYLVSPSFAEVDGRQVQVAGSPLSRIADDGIRALAPHTSARLETTGECVTGVNSVWRFVELNRTRPADWDSLAFAAGQLRAEMDDGSLLVGPLDWLLETSPARAGPCGGTPSQPSHLNLVTALGTLAVFAGVVALGLLAPRRPRVPQLLAVLVIGFLLVNKVYSPQYVLWLVPLVVLARPRWRLFLLWQATEAIVLFARFYYFVGLPPSESGEGIDVWWFVSAVLLRDVLLVVVAATIVREIWRPSLDVVRNGPDSADDPAGGVLDQAPDRRGRFAEPAGPAGPPEPPPAREPVPA